MKQVAKDIIHTIHSTNPLAMFAPQPVCVSFESQEKGEKIILLLRAHIITLIPVVLEILFLAVLPILVALLNFAGIDPFVSFKASQVFWILWELK